MNLNFRVVSASALLAGALFVSPLAMAQSSATDDAPYGSATFAAYDDIDSLESLKTVWDWSFSDPEQTDISMNFINALLNAVDEFGPNELDAAKTVVVSHGPESVIWAKQNYSKYKDIVDRAARLAERGVRIEVCRNNIRALGFEAEDLHGFVHVIPAGPYALAYWGNKGYSFIPGGSSTAQRPINDFNRADLGPREQE